MADNSSSGRPAPSPRKGRERRGGGTGRMTIHEFAKAIGVSTGTIYRAINNRPDVSARTREMVLKEMDRLGYRPSRAAQSLVTGKTEMIAVWVPGLSNTYAMEVLQALWHHLETEAYEMTIRDVSRSAPRAGEPAGAWPADGSIIVDPPEWVAEAVLAQKHPPPLVALGRLGLGPKLDYVGYDFSAAVREAVDHLVEGGARRVAYVAPRWDLHAGDERYDNYVAAMEAKGLQPQPLDLEQNSRNAAWAGIKEHLRGGSRPDALLCYNDDIAIGCHRGLRDLDVRIPRAMQIVGCDGIEDTLYLDPPLSTIQVPIPELCAIAWQYLRRRMENPGLPVQRIVLPARLVVRGTSGAGSRAGRPPRR